MKPMTQKEAKRNRWRIALSLPNYQRILKLKGIHRGLQCVIIATGPSVNITDLSLIEAHPFVMGVNGAYRLRNQFKYYFCSDSNFYFPNESEITRLKPDYFFFSSNIPFQPDARRIYLKLDEASAYARRPMKTFRTNLLRMLSWGPTVLLDLVLPTVLWMGFTEIVLLGADYSLENYRHFYPEMDHKVLVKKKDSYREMMLAREGFQVFVSTLKERKHNVVVHNCSPLSQLDFFEKKDLSEVILPRKDSLCPST